MATLLLFASAREAAGTNRLVLEGGTVGDVLDAAVLVAGDQLGRVIAHSKVWVDGEPADRNTEVSSSSEVAVLPPVSGG
jgi:sulfur-carrier protein